MQITLNFNLPPSALLEDFKDIVDKVKDDIDKIPFLFTSKNDKNHINNIVLVNDDTKTKIDGIIKGGNLEREYAVYEILSEILQIQLISICNDPNENKGDLKESYQHIYKTNIPMLYLVIDVVNHKTIGFKKVIFIVISKNIETIGIQKENEIIFRSYLQVSQNKSNMPKINISREKAQELLDKDINEFYVKIEPIYNIDKRIKLRDN